MSQSDKTNKTGILNSIWSFFADIFKSIFRVLMLLVLIFVITTGIAALVCFYYDVPLWFSLIGGFFSLGVVFFLNSDSIFD
jgi:ABC-type arginine/histidine transport system permease subunit